MDKDKKENKDVKKPAGKPTHRGPQSKSGSAPSAKRHSKSKYGAPHKRTEDSKVPKKEVEVPALAAGNVRIIPLGGVEEVGKNMTAIEFGDEIVVIDAGLQFPGEEAPGVDYIIPDTTYLEKNKAKIKGLVITHGHLDHIGGIPYILPKIGNPTVYTSLLTAVMIKKRQEEFTHLPKINIQVLKKDEKLKLGNFVIRFFAATHTIPDSMGVIVETPYGDIVCTGDIKIDHVDGEPTAAEKETFEKIGKRKNLLLIADSTNVEKPGFSFSEREVHENLQKIIKEVGGRLIIGTFASLLERIIYIILESERQGKKVAIEGRSMKNNIEIAKELGLLKTKKGTLIPSESLDDYPDNKIVILATGAQGDEFAALMRISKKSHKLVRLKPTDTILLSSSVIPGNEKAVAKLKDNLARQDASIIHYGIANIHSSGHSYRDEVMWVHKMVNPKFFIPVHGHHHMLRVHAKTAVEFGMKRENIIIPDNGSVIEVSEKGEKFTMLKENASSRVVMVDGLGTNGVQEVVIRDRQALSQDGMFVIIALVDVKTGKVRKSPDIISRGFVYLKESQDLLRHVRQTTKKTIENATAEMHPVNFDYVKNLVREDVGKYLFQKTHNRPIILPVLIEV